LNETQAKIKFQAQENTITTKAMLGLKEHITFCSQKFDRLVLLKFYLIFILVKLIFSSKYSRIQNILLKINSFLNLNVETY
jgi:predicted CDP-diglyceride synthetase/phosphatidate cytidylyltransferase